MVDTKKDKIEEAVKLLNKKYGAKTIIKMASIDKIKVEAIPTGSYSLDRVFGCGGIPRGRIVEMHGNEGSGKSTLALFIASQVQKKGGNVCWIDAEHAFDADYAKKIGVNSKQLFLSQPVYGEEALDIVDKMALSSDIDLIVLDSVAALVPKREFEGNLTDNEMAQGARMMSKAMRMLSGNISRTKTAVLFINQLREKIGVYWGNKNTTPGGKALKFFASVRIEVKKGRSIKEGEEVVGNKIIFCAVKNKVGMPFRMGQLDLIYGVGVDIFGDILDSAVDIGIISLEKTNYLYGVEPLGASRLKAIERLRSDSKIMLKIIEELKNAPYAKSIETETQGEGESPEI